MKIIHTSPMAIKKITKDGMFDDILFFSESRYVMTCSSTVYTYIMSVNENDYIHCSRLENMHILQEILDDIKKMELNLDPDLELAQSLLNGSKLICNLAPADCGDFSDYSEYEWEIQKYQGKCALKMGFKGCQSDDEQGNVYIVPMFGRESDLHLLRKDKLKPF